MNISIRNFLLINLLVALTITNTLTAIGNYYLDQEDIKLHLDSLLSQSTLSFEALLSNDLHDRNLKAIQKSLDAVPASAQKFFREIEKTYPDYDYEDKYQFQVWSTTGKLLLHSANSPTLPLSDGKTGFSDKYIDNIPWRVFTIFNEKLNVSIVVAERYDIRNELAHQITQDDIVIMLLTYLLSGILIWVIVGRGLSSIKRVANEVAHRAPTYLDPVDLESVPVEIKPLADELNRLFLRLQLAFEREKRFAGDAAHELRTPLAALKIQAQVALKTTEENERQAILQNMISGVDRCTYIVQQLLVLSQLVPESNQIADLSEIDLPKLSAEIIAQLAPAALDKRIDIELIAQDNIILIGNNTALGILIRNLVDNAIRYTPEDGTVQVTIEENKDTILFKVTDNGPGIPLELRSRVFERFFRVLGTKSTGSGLGLAIVQQIAKLHRAQVKLDTPPNGVGLEIKIIFPK